MQHESNAAMIHRKNYKAILNKSDAAVQNGRN
jgi:hypothetical protein